MALPVTVTRIQNRRGLQAQFDALYPPGYNGIGGYGNFPGYTPGSYPHVLREGEIGLTTDTRRVLIGNLNGEYIDIGSGALSGLIFSPFMISLPPSGTFVTMPSPGIEFNATPFFNVLYSLTDSASPNWNSVGIEFARNGQLQITATSSLYVALTDSSTEINTTVYDISFQAVYSGSNIVIQYKHNFPYTLTFSTTTIKWAPISTPLPPSYPTFDNITVTFDELSDTFDEGL